MTAALIIVDVQNDFCPGGALPVPNGDAVVPVLNAFARRLAAAGSPVIASRDWHPEHTSHFANAGGAWPVHCVQGTPGAAFYPGLELPPGTVVVSKGMGATEDAYSAFQARSEDGRSVLELLRQAGIQQVYVGGLATDYCVKATVLDALTAGFRATLLIDASRGVNIQRGDAEAAIEAMVRSGAGVVTLERVPAATAGAA